jgi:hypothetical protein
LQLLAATHERLGTNVLIHRRVCDRCTDTRELGVIQLTPDEVIEGISREAEDETGAAPPMVHGRSIGCTTARMSTAPSASVPSPDVTGELGG